MSSTTGKFSAAQSAAGYLYQARLALAEALRYAYSDASIEVAVEKLDDVSFESDGVPLELLQTKHHIGRVGDLTDASVDLWKTIRVWAEAAKSDPSLCGRTRLALVTTAQASPMSAAWHLRPHSTGTRDTSKAEAKLLDAAAASKNAALISAVAAFGALTPEMRKALISSVEIIDSAPLIADLQALIEDRLRMSAPRGRARLVREQLEGWWWGRICGALQAQPTGTILIAELEQKLDDIRDSIKRDSLPLTMEHVDPRQEDLDALNEMRFVRQLHFVGIGSVRLQYAKRDFYRASVQRAQWARENLIFDGEVAGFERTLVEEWQPRFAQMCDQLAKDCSVVDLNTAGQSLYSWVENEARFPIRAVSRRFLNVGSYHILADDLRVGWHRDYLTFATDPKKGNSGGN